MHTAGLVQFSLDHADLDGAACRGGVAWHLEDVDIEADNTLEDTVDAEVHLHLLTDGKGCGVSDLRLANECVVVLRDRVADDSARGLMQ